MIIPARGARPARTAVIAVAAALAHARGPLIVAPPAAADAPLRVHAAARGKFIGYAASTGPLANEAAYRSIAASEFNQVTAENAMKWESTEPSDGNYTFAGADQVVAFATANNQQVHGHTLVWHSQTPGWVQGLSATAMRTAMQDHIATVVGRYADNAGARVVGRGQRGVRRQRQPAHQLLAQHARLVVHRRRVPLRPRRRQRRAAVHQRLQRRGHQREEHRHVQPGAPATRRRRAGGLRRVPRPPRHPVRVPVAGAARTWSGSPALGVQVRITELDVRMQMPRDSHEGRDPGHLLPQRGQGLPGRDRVRGHHDLGLHRQVLVGAGRLLRRGRGAAVGRELLRRSRRTPRCTTRSTTARTPGRAGHHAADHTRHAGRLGGDLVRSLVVMDCLLGCGRCHGL